MVEFEPCSAALLVDCPCGCGEQCRFACCLHQDHNRVLGDPHRLLHWNPQSRDYDWILTWVTPPQPPVTSVEEVVERSEPRT